MISALVIAATIAGGPLGPFTGHAEWIAGNAVREKTPGGDDWYEKVESIKVPDKWAIYRNGVLTNCPPPHLVDDTASRYAKHFELDGCVTDEEHEHFYPTYWFPLFNCGPSEISWESHYFGEDGDYDCHYKAEATNVTDTSVAALDVWLPKTMRLDGDSFASVIASYEAYYERLYSGSAGERSVWNVNDWGPRQPGQAFAFNLKNSFASFDQYLPDPATNRLFWSHRLKEGRNINNLYRCVREMFPTECKTEWWDWHRDHPIDDALRSKSFIYRPGWALAHDGPSWLWWATSANIPGLKDERLLPDVPEWTPVSMIANMSNSFSKCATTLDMLAPTQVFDTKGAGASFPIWKMIENLSFGFDPIQDFSFKTQCTMYDVITNNFPNCCKGYARSPEWPDAGMWDYMSRVWDSDNASREDYRVNTKMLEGVNQVLSLMDRTIMVPHCEPRIKTRYRYYQKRAEYNTPSLIPITIEKQGDSYVLSQDSLEIEIGRTLETNMVYSEAIYEPGFLRFQVGDTDLGISARSPTEASTDRDYFIEPGKILPELEGAYGQLHKFNLISIGEFSNLPRGLILEFLWECRDEGPNFGRQYIVRNDVGAAGLNGETVYVNFEVGAYKGYSVERPVSLEVFLQEGLLPYDGEMAESTFGIFSWRANDSYTGYPNHFRCKEMAYSSRLGVSNSLVKIEKEYDEEIRDFVNSSIGVNNVEDVDEMIPMPSSVQIGKYFDKDIRLNAAGFNRYYNDSFVEVECADFPSGVVAHFFMTHPGGERIEFDYEQLPFGRLHFRFDPIASSQHVDTSDFEPLHTGVVQSVDFRIITRQDWKFKNMKRGTTK